MTSAEEQRPSPGGSWTRRGVLGGLLGAPVLLLAACSGDSDKGGGGGAASGASSSPKTSVAKITVSPADGVTDASFTDPVKVTVVDGKLGSVKLTGEDGKEIPGQLAADATSWASTGPLTSGTKYTVAAVATDADKLEADANTKFGTASPANTFIGYFTPENGATVGVGMPVSINFNKPVTNRKAVQQAITVTAQPGVEIVGHWFSSTRLDFRPEQYWAKGTKVTLQLRLKDVEGAKGVYGTQSKDVNFTVGRSQTSVADLSADTLTVTTDGQVTATYPIIGGAPEHKTWAGKLVISEQYQQTKMDSATVGLGDEYNIPDVPHAQRLTTSGTFIHGNYWSPDSQFGNANTSHGCIALKDAKGASDPNTNGAKFYASSIVGDVVEVINSGDKTVDPSNGLNGWNMDWATWRAGSAV
ncbi:lipoprotein-anchoring transpeptidase ErfK/SrfK [Kitasatospora gansuensis]|uniref:Lipoprotein-anchoring transpeptidase ErfK/SrfK n=1 Tax=Kitasatospora gansuensis TaxID=258050 RepID=A0A7W7SC00_9ACTN|nr:Ig-like domain-containing protein [Kitasatospora gansuensis]MBB4947227.1 lipoprotein-anchoring transpeptidase ErfK/SrfK [Kitasatospora gansuensis]